MLEVGGNTFDSIKDVINYASRSNKITESENKIELVSTINCCRDSAFEEMLQIKRKYAKTDKVLAWHGYQSFKPGEVTPELAHKIGIELANELWGDRFQVVVTTHLDKSHIHNHFVLNSVSFLDGKKYLANKKTYFKMREVSDRLCYNYGLSVVENPKYNGITRGEYRAASDNKYTVEKIVKQAVDSAIRNSKSINDFISLMNMDGYSIDFSGKYATLKVPGHRAIRLDRRFGEAYSFNGIVNQIQYYKDHPVYSKPIKKYYRGKFKPGVKISGFKGLYIRYLYILGERPKKKQMSNKQMHFLLREDLMQLDKITAEMDFIRKYDIVSSFELSSVKAVKQNAYNVLADERKSIRNKLRRCKEYEKGGYEEQLKVLNAQIKDLRKDLFYCNDIEERSKKMKEKMELNRSRNRGDDNWKEETNMR